MLVANLAKVIVAAYSFHLSSQRYRSLSILTICLCIGWLKKRTSRPRFFSYQLRFSKSLTVSNSKQTLGIFSSVIPTTIHQSMPQDLMASIHINDIVQSEIFSQKPGFQTTTTASGSATTRTLVANMTRLSKSMGLGKQPKQVTKHEKQQPKLPKHLLKLRYWQN